MSLGVSSSCVLVLAALLSLPASAQVWIESGDAPSFPDGPAQVTRGETLDTIRGSTGAGDWRDAYCLQITEPSSFLATTDPTTSPTANADFDTRLFLFRDDGAPVLANDDTFPQAPPFLSTLTGSATDGSGFELSQPGEYVLVVGGSPEDPQDPTDRQLFDIDSDLDAVHARGLMAERFDHWEEGAPATGSYEIFLSGARPCQNELDAVSANISDVEPNRSCLGDGLGGFLCSDVSADSYSSRGVALGFVNGDPHLDAVFANTSAQRNRLCLGDGVGGFTCSDVSIDAENTRSVALGFVDGDQNLDAVFAYGNNRVCLGDGLGGFTCGSFSDLVYATRDVALGFVDGDRHLDAVFANTSAQRNRVCLGDGSGVFACSDVSTDANYTRSVALGFIDGDENLDAVFANTGFQRNRVCLGDGAGAFTCSDVSADEDSTYRVELGFVDGDQKLDAVFANPDGQRNRVCLGDGVGGFTCSDVSPDPNDTKSVALGFVDGDQNLDAVFANTASQRNRVCLGDGLGGFTCGDLGVDQDGTLDVALGEVAFPTMSMLLFSDGFESGGTSAWSGTTP